MLQLFRRKKLLGNVPPRTGEITPTVSIPLKAGAIETYADILEDNQSAPLQDGRGKQDLSCWRRDLAWSLKISSIWRNAIRLAEKGNFVRTEIVLSTVVERREVLEKLSGAEKIPFILLSAACRSARGGKLPPRLREILSQTVVEGEPGLCASMRQMLELALTGAPASPSAVNEWILKNNRIAAGKINENRRLK